MSDIRNLGVFETIDALWAAHPEGGQEGDYAYIGASQAAGTKYRWNKYDRIWENAATVTQSTGRKNQMLDGDFTVNGKAKFGGNTRVAGNLYVGGLLDAKNVKTPCRGLFSTVEDLEEAYPNPEPGWWAIVGDAVPGPLYHVVNGAWEAILDDNDDPVEGGGGEIDMGPYLELIEERMQDVEDAVEEVPGIVETEVDKFKHKFETAIDDSYLVKNFTKEVVDFTTAPTRNYNLIVETTKYGTSTTYKHSIFQAEEGDVVDVTANSSYETRVAFVTNLNRPTSGGDVPVVSGSSIVAVSVDVSKRFVAPAGTVAVLIHIGTGTSAPSYMAIYRQKKSYSGDKTITMVTANGYKADASTVGNNTSYYGLACPVKSGKTYLVKIYNAGTAAKYFGFVTGVPVDGAEVNYRDIKNDADIQCYLTPSENGYLLVTKASSGFSVSVVEQGDTIRLGGEEKDIALALQYDKKDVLNSYQKRNYALVEGTGKYNSDSSFKHIIIPVSPGQYVKVTANSDYRSVIAFLTNDDAPVASSMPNYAPGTGSVYIPIDTTELLKVPSGANYLLVFLGSTGLNFGSVPAFIGITSLSPVLPITISPAKKSFSCMLGALRYTNGGYAIYAQYLSGYSHTPKFIRNYGWFSVNYSGQFGICFYDSDQNYIGYYLEEEGGPVTFERKDFAFFRVWTRTEEVHSIEIESYWTGDDEVFQKLPEDEGYQPMAFGVNINKGFIPNDTGDSAVTTGYVKSSNYGILHLPESYKETGEATPLIIYLHGASERYGLSSTRFGSNVRYSPEWDAMGFAQMDVDMVPDVYETGTSSNAQCGTGDDAACVEAAYNWAIHHFNIRRDGVYLFGRSRGGMAVLSILAKLNQVKLPVVCALSNAGANSMLLYGLFRNSNSTFWRIFCESMGLDYLTPPSYNSGLIIANPTIAQFLRNNIHIWWKKAMVALPLCVENPTEYQTPTQIFDLLVSSYTSANPGKTFIENFVEKCKFRSPVPLRFDWCAGDTIQPWESTAYGNYGSAGKNGFVNNELSGNAVYRRWPSCVPDEEPHYHEKFNLVDGDYTMPNGKTVENASMAMVEWLLWAMGHDERFTI